MSGGVRTALEAVLEGDDEPEVVAQTGLFDDLDVSETGATAAPSPLSLAISPPKRGPGRRPGSKNRRTEAVVSWLLAQHRHPLSVMMEAYSMTPADLAQRIGIAAPDADQLLDIFKLQVRMAEACAPYVAQRLPQAVQIDAKAGLTISLEGVSFPARAGPVGKSDAIEGQVLGVRLPSSRTDEVG